MSGGLHVALLAAGAGRRFGGGKLDRRVAGRPLGRIALDTASALAGARHIVVVGSPVPEFARVAGEEGRAALVVNACAADGLGTSVAAAARAASAAGADALLLMLADMPLVRLETLQALAGAAVPGTPAAVRHDDGNPGIPACFTRDWFERLANLNGEAGAGRLLRSAESVALVAAGAGELLDVDTAADLAAVESLLQSAP